MTSQRVSLADADSFGVPAGLPLVCVQGLGFVGAANAIAIASARDEADQPLFDVIGLDLPNSMGIERSEAINTGRFPFPTTDDQLKRAVVNYLVGGLKAGASDDVIRDAAAEFDRRDAVTQQLAKRFTIRGRVAIVDTEGYAGQFDKTDLLLAGQAKVPVAMVRDSGQLSIAAAFDSGWDFVALFELGGGMPTRVTIPEGKLDDAVAKINDAPLPTPRAVKRDEE